MHCIAPTPSLYINLFSFFTCYFGYNSTVLSHRPVFCNSTVLSHRPDFWPAAHVVGCKNLSIYLSIT